MSEQSTRLGGDADAPSLVPLLSAFKRPACPRQASELIAFVLGGRKEEPGKGGGRRRWRSSGAGSAPHTCPYRSQGSFVLVAVVFRRRGRDGAEEGVGRVEDGRSGFVRIRDEPPSSLSWCSDRVEEEQRDRGSWKACSPPPSFVHATSLRAHGC